MIDDILQSLHEHPFYKTQEGQERYFTFAEKVLRNGNVADLDVLLDHNYYVIYHMGQRNDHDWSWHWDHINQLWAHKKNLLLHDTSREPLIKWSRNPDIFYQKYQLGSEMTAELLHFENALTLATPQAKSHDEHMMLLRRVMQFRTSLNVNIASYVIDNGVTFTPVTIKYSIRDLINQVIQNWALHDLNIEPYTLTAAELKSANQFSIESRDAAHAERELLFKPLPITPVLTKTPQIDIPLQNIQQHNTVSEQTIKQYEPMVDHDTTNQDNHNPGISQNTSTKINTDAPPTMSLEKRNAAIEQCLSNILYLTRAIEHQEEYNQALLSIFKPESVYHTDAQIEAIAFFIKISNMIFYNDFHHETRYNAIASWLMRIQTILLTADAPDDDKVRRALDLDNNTEILKAYSYNVEKMALLKQFDTQTESLIKVQKQLLDRQQDNADLQKRIALAQCVMDLQAELLWTVQHNMQMQRPHPVSMRQPTTYTIIEADLLKKTSDYAAAIITQCLTPDYTEDNMRKLQNMRLEIIDHPHYHLLSGYSKHKLELLWRYTVNGAMITAILFAIGMIFTITPNSFFHVAAHWAAVQNHHWGIALVGKYSNLAAASIVAGAGLGFCIGTITTLYLNFRTPPAPECVDIQNTVFAKTIAVAKGPQSSNLPLRKGVQFI